MLWYILVFSVIISVFVWIRLLHTAHSWTDGRNFCFRMLLGLWRVKNPSVTANFCNEQQRLESEYRCFPFLHRQPTNQPTTLCTSWSVWLWWDSHPLSLATHLSASPPVEGGGTERVNGINMFWLHKMSIPRILAWLETSCWATLVFTIED